MFNEHVKNFTEITDEITKKESQFVDAIRKASVEGRQRGLTETEVIQEQMKMYLTHLLLKMMI